MKSKIKPNYTNALDKKFGKKTLTLKDIGFDNRQVKITTTKDIALFLNEHVVWCPRCNSEFTSMVLHAKRTNNKMMKDDCIKENKKIFNR